MCILDIAAKQWHVGIHLQYIKLNTSVMNCYYDLCIIAI